MDLSDSLYRYCKDIKWVFTKKKCYKTNSLLFYIERRNFMFYASFMLSDTVVHPIPSDLNFDDITGSKKSGSTTSSLFLK